MNRVPVAVDQLVAFKLQAKRFAAVVSRITNSNVCVRKSNREDFLAWTCGYRNFSELSIVAKSLPPANAALVLADTPEKRAVLGARCLTNPFGRLDAASAEKAVSLLPAPITPLIFPVEVRDAADLDFLVDPSECEWIYKDIRFDECPGLSGLRQAVMALSNASIHKQRQQVFAKVIGAQSHKHAEMLRQKLDDLLPGFADIIDRSISVIRSSTRRIQELRVDNNTTAEIAGLYTYWRHSTDVIGKGGLSESAIRRQFVHFFLALGSNPSFKLSTTWPCPSCGREAIVRLSDVSNKRVDSMELNCLSCSHEERYTQYARWSSTEPLNKIRCQCTTCRKTVLQIANSLSTSSLSLWSGVANWVLIAAQKEKSRLMTLQHRPRTTNPEHLSPRALKFAKLAASNRSISIWGKVCELVNDDVRRSRGRSDACYAFVDELIAVGSVGVAFDSLTEPEDYQSVLRCLFAEQADYWDQLNRRRAEDYGRDSGRRWPHDGPWKADWQALLSRLLRGYRANDRDDFIEWFDAINESDLLTSTFRMPFLMGLYIQPDAVKQLTSGERHG